MSDMELLIGAIAVAAIVTVVWVRVRQARTRIYDDPPEIEPALEARAPQPPAAASPAFPSSVGTPHAPVPARPPEAPAPPAAVASPAPQAPEPPAVVEPPLVLPEPTPAPVATAPSPEPPTPEPKRPMMSPAMAPALRSTTASRPAVSALGRQPIKPIGDIQQRPTPAPPIARDSATPSPAEARRVSPAPAPARELRRPPTAPSRATPVPAATPPTPAPPIAREPARPATESPIARTAPPPEPVAEPAPPAPPVEAAAPPPTPAAEPSPQKSALGAATLAKSVASADPAAAKAAAPAAPSGIVSRLIASNPETAELEKNDTRHHAARRFARVAVSEIKMYREADVAAGRKAKDLWKRLHDDIALCVETYEAKIPKDVRERFDYLYDEILRQLAEGDPQKLGPDAPTTSSRGR